jgi:hypothetical protein
MSGMVRLVSTWQNVMNPEIDVFREREKKVCKNTLSTNDTKIGLTRMPPSKLL